MRHVSAFLSLALVLTLGMLENLSFGSGGSGNSGSSETPSDLVIYTYDSFAAQGGLGPEVIPIFEKQCRCKVRLLPSGDAGQLLSRLQLDAERKKPTAHIVLGLDQYLWVKARKYLEFWDEKDGWVPKGYSSLNEVFRVENGFLPFDYGVLAMFADMQGLKKAGLSPPTSLRELQEPRWKKRFILENPKTSTPGLAFLLLTQAALKDDLWSFWSQLRHQWLLMAPGWNGAYGLFLRGEAPLVWSYITSQAYHREHGDSAQAPRFQAVLFNEGQPLQIEGAALVKGAFQTPEERRRAREFLEFLLSDEVQKRIPLKNWMNPVRVSETMELPFSFRSLPQPKKLIRYQGTPAELDALLKRWGAVVETGAAD